MIEVYGRIKFVCEKGHPEYKKLENKFHVFEFEDIYTIDIDRFESWIEVENYLINDLKLVAGGGYSTDNVGLIEYEVKQATEKHWNAVRARLKGL